MVINDPDLLLIEDGVYCGMYGNMADTERPDAFVCGVSVAIEDHEYRSITVRDNETSQRMLNGSGVIEQLTDRILECQSLHVDAVSGATATGNAFLKAVEQSLAGMQALPDNLFGLQGSD